MKTRDHRLIKHDTYVFQEFLASMDPRNARNIGMLTETIEFLDGVRSPGDMLSYVEPAGKKIPLATCGHVKSECWRTGVVPTKACSGCKCIRYCGPEHQKSVRGLESSETESRGQVRY